MKLEGSEEINDAIYCARNSTQLLGICKMLLSQLKETTWHGLKWNNSPVSPVVMGYFFFCRGLVFVYSVLACDTHLLKFQEKTHGQNNS